MTISRNLSILAEGVSSTGVLSAAYGGALAWQSVQTGNFTAVAGNSYPVNTTSGAVTVTLPASPSVGQQIAISDYAGTFAKYNCIINPNGNKISGSTANVILNVSRESAAIVYVDSTQGWIGYGNSTTNPVGPYTISYLIVAGGGGGGSDWGGGGGAGGVLTGTTTLLQGTVYSLVVGAGGAGGLPVGQNGFSGINSTGFGLTAIGGGRGGTYSSGAGSSGGSGGGGGGSSGAGAAGTNGQGYAGATASGYAGGGGGSGGLSSSKDGGASSSSSITGTLVAYAGGGGGGAQSGTGGAGGGGSAGTGGTPQGGSGTSATVNTGSGGGGGAAGNGSTATGGAGGSGVVILSIPTANYTGTKTGAPTVTTSGAYTILTFTASGSYTA